MCCGVIIKQLAQRQVKEYRQKLWELAAQLEKWADESLYGGWSTHQVKPMRDKAKDIFAFLGKGGN
jgi:hypothetical protein